MTLQLVHSSQRLIDSERGPVCRLAVIQGGRDPIAKAKVKEALLAKSHEETLARLQTEEAERQRKHEEHMRESCRRYARKRRLTLAWSAFVSFSLALMMFLPALHIPWVAYGGVLLIASAVQALLLRKAIS